MNKNTNLNKTRTDLRVEGRVNGSQYSEIVMKEESHGVYRLDSPTHPDFWAKIVTPFAVQSVDNLVLRILQRNDRGHGNPQLSPFHMMKGFAKFYLEKWIENPSKLLERIDEWSNEWYDTQAVHWPIFDSDSAVSTDDLCGMDRQFYNLFVEAGGLDKFKVSFGRLVGKESWEGNWSKLLFDGGLSTSILSDDDWPQFSHLVPNNNYAIIIQPN